MIIKREVGLINKDIDDREYKKPIRKVLPFLLFLSFVWLCLFDGISYINGNMADYITFGYSEMFGSATIFGFLITVLVEFLWFEIVYYLYKALISFSNLVYKLFTSLFFNWL